MFMSPLGLAIIIFDAIVEAVFSFAAAAFAPSSVLGTRLRALGWQGEPEPEKPPIRERIEQALDPLSKALPLSPAEVSKARGWLIQAGYRDSRHVSMYVGSRILFGLLGIGLVVLISGFDSMFLMVGVGAFGFFLPRFILKRMIQERQHRIKIGLPDALD